MKKTVLCFLILIPAACLAQKKIKTLELSDTIISAAVDRPGEFYLMTVSGQIQKFDKNGKLLVLYRHKGAPTLFDPRDGSRLFAYYRDQQQYDYLNPVFEVTAAYKIDDVFAIAPWLVTTSGDHKLWILDAVDHSLKKLNATHTAVEVEIVVDTTLIDDATTFTAMRDYQGFLFLLNPEKGIYIFNGLGKHIRTIEVSGISDFNFLGEELYYYKEGKINFFDLFSAESRSMECTGAPNTVLLTDERMLKVSFKSVDIFEFRP